MTHSVIETEPVADRRAEVLATIGSQLFESSSRPRLILERDYRILCSNALARALLRDGRMVYEHLGALKGRRREIMRALDASVAQLRRQHCSANGRLAQWVALDLAACRTGQARLLARLSRVPIVSSSTLAGQDDLILLTVLSCGVSNPLESSIRHSLFQLTPAEGRVARALMNGDRLCDIAAAQHISLETVRAHLRSLFLKTDTHRQSELVALLWRASDG